MAKAVSPDPVAVQKEMDEMKQRLADGSATTNRPAP